eukprot:230650_1
MLQLQVDKKRTLLACISDESTDAFEFEASDNCWIHGHKYIYGLPFLILGIIGIISRSNDVISCVFIAIGLVICIIYILHNACNNYLCSRNKYHIIFDKNEYMVNIYQNRTIIHSIKYNNFGCLFFETKTEEQCGFVCEGIVPDCGYYNGGILYLLDKNSKEWRINDRLIVNGNIDKTKDMVEKVNQYFNDILKTMELHICENDIIIEQEMDKFS